MYSIISGSTQVPLVPSSKRATHVQVFYVPQITLSHGSAVLFSSTSLRTLVVFYLEPLFASFLSFISMNCSSNNLIVFGDLGIPFVLSFQL
jgi:hypothetical protein